MQLGKVAMEIFPKTGTLRTAGMMNAGDILYVIGWLTATVMWGFGLVWLFFAAASISRSKFPFNMGWWGFTFPLGVFTTSTTQMAKELPSTFFKVLGTVSSTHLVVEIRTDDDADLLRSGYFALDLGYDQNSDESCYWRYVLRALLERSRGKEGRG
jgi:hypothetical protein